MPIRVLSMDPGTAAYAASVLTVSPSDERLRVRVDGTCMVKNTVRDMKKLVLHVKAFQSEMRRLTRNHGPFDLVVAERFQSRGNKGTTIESINVMLGVLATMYPQLVVYTAATWKNRANAHFDLKSLYAELKEEMRPLKPRERRQIHELDCATMGVYHASKSLGIDPYADWDDRRATAFLRHVIGSGKL